VRLSGKNSVLVVEDDKALRDMYRSALRGAGYDVVAVEDGADALRYVEHQRQNAVVLDLALPRIGGRDVNRELKARPETRQIPVVVVTGTDMSDLDPQDFSSMLMKPVQGDALVWAVDNSIRRARVRGGDDI
jgi:CheY-like chemotaxis protein